MTIKEDILLDAIRITRERGEAYGPPGDHFARTAGMINALLSHKLREPLTAADWGAMMILDKLARDQTVVSYDNDLDGIGYFACRHEIKSSTLSVSSPEDPETISGEVNQ